MKPKRERKIYYAHYDAESDPHPVIRIAGKFLEKLGFGIGVTISVEYENDRITIMKTQKIKQKELKEENNVSKQNLANR